MFQLETQDGKVLGKHFDLATARQVKARIYREYKIWLNIVKQTTH